MILSISCESYVIGPNPLNWTASQEYCNQIGTTLASVHSQSEFNQTREICANAKGINVGCWVGLNNINDKWEWDDNTITNYGFTINTSNSNIIPTRGIFPWANGSHKEPNNYQGIEHCVENRIGFEYLWNDQSCFEERYPICNNPTGLFCFDIN